MLYLEWKATGGGRKIEDGIGTFIFQDGMIRVQTVVYNRPAGWCQPVASRPAKSKRPR